MNKLLPLVFLLAFTATASGQQVNNTTVELNFGPSNAYMDGQTYEGSTVISDPSFGYVSTSQPLGIVSYGRNPLRIGFIDSEKYYVTQKSGEFIIPFTRNGPSSIENRQELIENAKLMDELNPRIGFPSGAERIIRVSYLFGYTVHELTGPKNGIEEVLVRNRIHTGNQTELILKTE